jgi:predicted transport protein
MMTLDEFFKGYKESRRLFDVVLSVIKTIGPVELRVTKSQIAFRQSKNFAWVWIPGKYLHGKTAPLVLTLSFHRRDTSARWKEIVEPSPGRFTHHLELYSVNDIDNEVRNWLQEAWTTANL